MAIYFDIGSEGYERSFLVGFLAITIRGLESQLFECFEEPRHEQQRIVSSLGQHGPKEAGISQPNAYLLLAHSV
jgi:hypothetical protein